MEAALAEMALDDIKDVEDDNDFVNDKGTVVWLTSICSWFLIFIPVEEDILFASDFESTDEEAEKVVGEAGENEIIDEERRIRKVNVISGLNFYGV